MWNLKFDLKVYFSENWKLKIKICIFKGQLLIFTKIEWTECLRTGQRTSGSNKRHRHKGRQGLHWEFKSSKIYSGNLSRLRVIAVPFRG